MPRQFEASARRSIGLVAALKRAQCIRFGHRAEPPFGGSFTGMAIMIAAHQYHLDVTVTRSEGSEVVIEGCGVAGFGVHQIAQNNEALRSMHD